MEFGKHIAKGFWGFADKALPAVYGLAFMFIVIRNLPSEEYGALVLFQTIFMLIISLGSSLTVQPMVKYVAEGLDVGATASAALMMLFVFCFILIAGIMIFIKPLVLMLDSEHAEIVKSLFMYLPLLILITLYRLIAGGILQAKLEIKGLFFVDLGYYGLSTLFLIAAKLFGFLKDAYVVVYILLLTSIIASILSFFLSRHIAVPSFKLNKQILIRILKYGGYGLGNNVGYTVYSQFDNFFVSSVGGVAGVAVYNAAKTFTRAFDIFTQVIQTLVVPASSMLQEQNAREKLRVLVEKTICFSFFAIVPVVIIFELLPKELFSFIYGDRYRESIPILRTLAILGLIVPWASVISSVLYGIGKVRIGFLLSIVMLVLSFILYPIFGNLLGLKGIVFSVIVVQVVITVMGVFMLKRYVAFSLFSVFTRTRDVFEYMKKQKSKILRKNDIK